MRSSDVIDVIVITRRHVGGILNMNRDGLTCGILKKSYSKVICKPCISTGVQVSTSICKFKTLHCCNKDTSNMAAFTIIDRMTLLSLRVKCTV